MMTKHKRQLIREAVVTALKKIEKFKGNVFPSRVYHYDQDDVPGALVYTTSESAESEPFIDGQLYRTLLVVIEAHVSGADIDNQLDAIALDIENVFFENCNLNGLVQSLSYIGSEITLNGDSGSRIGVITMTLSCFYLS